MPHASPHLLDVFGFLVGVASICVGIYLRTLSYHDYPVAFPAAFAIIGWVMLLMNVEPFFIDPHVPVIARALAYAILSAAAVAGIVHIYRNYRIASPRETITEAVNGDDDDTT